MYNHIPANIPKGMDIWEFYWKDKDPYYYQSEYARRLKMVKEVVVIKATWCGPCQAYGPVIEEIKPEIEKKGYIVRIVDADENPEFCQKHGVRGVPTTLIIDNEKVLSTLVGFQPKDAVLEKLV